MRLARSTPRLAFGRFAQETNSFSRVLTEMAGFESLQYVEGDALLAHPFLGAPDAGWASLVMTDGAPARRERAARSCAGSWTRRRTCAR